MDMNKFETLEGGVCAAKGFKASGVYCAVKENPTRKNDIAMIVSDVMCNAAGVYTQNKVKGAPVIVTKKNLARSGGRAKAVIVNSKNANTCNADGEEKACEMCRLTADALGIKPEEVIVASTGVIGQVLPIEPIRRAVPQLVEKLSYTGNAEAAVAIMTTDTVKKEYAVKFTVGGKECHLGGMAKGSGMIHPNMATTLNFITTDCAVSVPMLQKALSEIVKITYNCLSVDGDQSTNDTCMLISSGLAGNAEITGENADFDTLLAHLEHFLRLCGEEHVALGGDLDGCDELANGFENLENYTDFYSYLQGKGYSTELLNKIFFENLLNLL